MASMAGMETDEAPCHAATPPATPPSVAPPAIRPMTRLAVWGSNRSFTTPQNPEIATAPKLVV